MTQQLHPAIEAELRKQWSIAHDRMIANKRRMESADSDDLRADYDAMRWYYAGKKTALENVYADITGCNFFTREPEGTEE